MKKIKYLIFLLVISSCNQYLGKVEPDYIPKNEVNEIFSNYKDDDNFSEVEFGDIIFPKLSNSSLNINNIEIDKIINTNKDTVIDFINGKIILANNKSLHLIDNNQDNIEFDLNLDKDEDALHIFQFNNIIHIFTNKSRLLYVESQKVSEAAKFDIFTNTMPILFNNTLIIFSVFGEIFEINLDTYSISKKDNFNPNPGITLKSNVYEDSTNLYYLFNTGTLLTFNKNNSDYYNNYILEDLNILTSLGGFEELLDAPFSYNENLYFIDRSGKISAFNPATSEIFWEIDLNGTILYYLFSSDGHLAILTLDKILILSKYGKVINSYIHNNESPQLIFSANNSINLISEEGIHIIDINNKTEDYFYKNKFTINLEIFFQNQNIYLKDDKSLFKLSE